MCYIDNIYMVFDFIFVLDYKVWVLELVCKFMFWEKAGELG